MVRLREITPSPTPEWLVIQRQAKEDFDRANALKAAGKFDEASELFIQAGATYEGSFNQVKPGETNLRAIISIGSAQSYLQGGDYNGALRMAKACLANISAEETKYPYHSFESRRIITIVEKHFEPPTSV